MKGSIVAIVTPMLKNGDIDFASFKNLLSFHANAGTDGIVLVGTTGESATLNKKERAEIFSFANSNTDIPLMAGVGSSSTAEAIELVECSLKNGIKKCLAVTPYYNKPSQKGLELHYIELSKVGAEIILYNVPGRTGVDLLPITIEKLIEIKTIDVGPPEDFKNFVNAVIDEIAFDKIASYLDYAKESNDCEVLCGGGYDKSKGYFVEPTVILTTDPHFKTLEEEIFGPVLTIFVYENENWNETLELIDNTSPYALTGCVFSEDRDIVEEVRSKLRFSAGNFYINDKPTGAVVGQQPFGGSRASGTNDKGGSMLNLLRWTSPRTIKETFEPPHNYRYPFMDEE